MAQVKVSFPWHSHSENRVQQSMSEKLTETSRKASDTSDTVGDVTNKSLPFRSPSEKLKLNGRSKKRSGSIRMPHSTRNTPKPQVEPLPVILGPRHYNVRTIPPWVRDADEDDLIEAQEHLDSPHAALVAQHNSTPSSTQRKSSKRGKHPTSSGALRDDQTSRWISFARASAYPREQFDGEKVDTEWLNENFTDYSKPWLADHNEDDPENDNSKYRAFKRKRQVWYKRAQFTILRNPFVPLAFRATVLLFAACAIGLGASIYHEADIIVRCLNIAPGARPSECLGKVGNEQVRYYRDPSALMAIVVDVISIAYTIYITYDEYFSKPLGLRPAKAKVRLVLLDLVFIVFQAANLALCFESLTVDEGACAVGTEPDTSARFDKVCNRAQALSGVLTVSLVAWLFTFSVSILRLVERINVK